MTQGTQKPCDSSERGPQKNGKLDMDQLELDIDMDIVYWIWMLDMDQLESIYAGFCWMLIHKTGI